MGYLSLKTCKLLAPALILSGYGVFARSGSFTFYDAEDLDVTYGTACINSISSAIDCHEYTRTMTTLSYWFSLGYVSFTNEICTADCSSSLSTWYNSVARECVGKELDVSVPKSLEDTRGQDSVRPAPRIPRPRATATRHAAGRDLLHLLCP
ncbi:hypothetical protein CORC01_04169 [Colletotrichum orchidophilum]|uniref:Uncharacterized protein n=1 Tax=Colletotrichum orchidophilum TaxID=1209926 RepID=A0A1G4BGA6_9PEZI|nr:uncharacterized protein CORC01_04169 [Colletotrichum orchidophilum]OHF00419.1 hypothetical protein CORC01_04169 [Colletotrichum orchidophilum]